LSLALDRDRLSKIFSSPAVNGGVVPPGIPGHSPNIGVHYDPERARQLLAEAGYPNGSGLPVIKGNTHFDHYSYFVEIAAQWRAELGFQVQIEVSTRLDADFFDCSLFFAGWITDFPDPHNLICQSSFITKWNHSFIVLMLYNPCIMDL